MAFGFRTRKKNSADVIFTNGKVYTGSDGEDFVSAVAVKDGRVMVLGDSEAI